MTELIIKYPSLQWALLLLLFAAVVLGTYAVIVLVGERGALRERLAVPGEAVLGHGGDAVVTMAGSLRADRTQGRWTSLIGAIEKSGIPLVDTKDESLRGKLVAAGYSSPLAPRAYALIRLGLLVGLPALFFLYLAVSGQRPGIVKLYVFAMIAAVIGMYSPVLFIRIRAGNRQRDLINGFPDALDLMLVCVEAGLGLEAAFGRVGMEMTRSHPLLAEQLGAVVLELRAGRSREDALRRMADRAGVDEIRAFATLLIQSTKLGSSIGQTLRIYAAEMREKRRMRAEEKAHKLPVLLSIPLVAFMLPVMIGVLMLPAVIRVVRVLLPAMAGHYTGN
ncbi:MAG: type II secretion system F family protein [Sphingomicrobium sp.]